MKGFKNDNQHKRFGIAKLIALSLTTGLLVTGCMITEDSNSPNTQTPTPTTTLPDAYDVKAAQCGPFTPEKAEVMCTMQYDPVCVKHKAPNGQISYKTAGNACTACTTPTAISHTPGECGTGLPTH